MILPVDSHRDIAMQHRPYRHVQQEKKGGGQIMDKGYVHHHKGESDADDADHGLPLGHSQSDELVVDMVLVRQEKGLAAAPTVQDYPYHIQHGYDQERERDHDGTGKDAFLHRVGHAQTDGHHREQHPDGERAGIAHEYLASALYAAIDILVEEREQHAERGEGDEGVHPPLQPDEHAPESEEGDDAESGSQPVDTVNQVDGVQDIDDDEYRKRRAYIIRYGSDAEQPVQVVEAKPGCDQQDAAYDLYHELGTVAHADQVVHHPRKVKQEQAAEHGKQTVGQVHVEHVAVHPQVVEDDGERRRDGDAREEGNASQPRDRSGMQLAAVNLVEQTAAKRYQRDTGQGYRAQGISDNNRENEFDEMKNVHLLIYKTSLHRGFGFREGLRSGRDVPRRKRP